MQAGLVPCTLQPSGRCKSRSRWTPHSAGTSGSHQFHIVSQGRAHRWILQAAFCSSGHAEAATSQKPPEHLSCPHAPVRHTGPIPTATICMDEGCSGLEQDCPCCCLQCSPRRVCTRSPNIPLAYGGLSKSRQMSLGFCWEGLETPRPSRLHLCCSSKRTFPKTTHANEILVYIT